VKAAKPEKVEEAVLGSQELTDLFGLDDADVADPFLALVKTIAHDLSTKLNDEMAEHMIENRVFNVIPQGFLTPEISAQADMLMQRMQPEKLQAILKFASLFGGGGGGQ
jgi:hypothetical protein